MNAKLIRLESIADAAHAQLRQCGESLRKAREEFDALDRHRENLEEKDFSLSAPDKTRHETLSARIEHLVEKYDELRADHRAKRDLFTRCKEHADG
ncbi:hypothetical protein [Salinisphaera sp. Q1T1-3]|uniref:hypothetical protein n=1 Tax=Salinisphaera sp. Q1T1-3 TaxID=2321229 RepID=UPI000E747DF3|nr:hypothetical protein [Salinisphaera sp. Q1T1-3]RJS95282.1 hypothetical protein D3260_01650 [Salinisphaera sp. Q1T1-3]